MTKPSTKPGDKYGKLTVLSQSGKDKNGRILYDCRCDCGGTKTVAGTHLRKGMVKSCGCLLRNPSEASRQKIAIGQRKRGASKYYKYKGGNLFRPLAGVDEDF